MKSEVVKSQVESRNGSSINWNDNSLHIDCSSFVALAFCLFLCG